MIFATMICAAFISVGALFDGLGNNYVDYTKKQRRIFKRCGMALLLVGVVCLVIITGLNIIYTLGSW